MFVLCVSSDHLYGFYQEMGTLVFWIFHMGTRQFFEGLLEEEKEFLPSVCLGRRLRCAHTGDSGLDTPETPDSLRSVFGREVKTPLDRGPEVERK